MEWLSANLKGRFIELGCFQSLITVSDWVQKAPPAPPAATVVRFIAVVPPALPENGSRGEEEEEGIPFCVDLCHPPIGSHSRSPPQPSSFHSLQVGNVAHE